MGLLRDRGVEFDLVDYLKTPPSRAELARIVERMDDPPIALVRTADKKFTVLGIDPGTLTTKKAVVDLLADHPEVMQRPVLVRGDRAVIARPPDRVAELLD